MRCYICKNEAKEIKPLGDYIHINCSLCGEYKVSGTAVKNLKIKTLNPDRILGKLAEYRQQKNEIPMITEIDL